MKQTIDDFLISVPTLLAMEPDAEKRQATQKTAAWFEEVKNRILLCEYHGIQIFEYRGRRSKVPSKEVRQRLLSLEIPTSDSVREIIEDLRAITNTALFNINVISPPPAPIYAWDGLENGEDFHKAAATIWANTAFQRSLWNRLKAGMGAKLSRLCPSAGKARRKYADELKKEICAAIDAIASHPDQKPHGASSSIEWKSSDGTTKQVSLAWAALQMTCFLIYATLKPPLKGELRYILETKHPELKVSPGAWAKVWKAAGLEWLGRKGKW